MLTPALFGQVAPIRFIMMSGYFFSLECAQLFTQTTWATPLARPALERPGKILYSLRTCHLQALLELVRVNIAISHKFSKEARQWHPLAPSCTHIEQVLQEHFNGWWIRPVRAKEYSTTTT